MRARAEADDEPGGPGASDPAPPAPEPSRTPDAADGDLERTTALTADAGIVRAGAAAAARRRQLDISQRGLAESGVMNAGALISFEKGRSWPRAGTREKLEDVLQWPHGTLASLRAGAPPPDPDHSTDDDRSTDVLRDTAGLPILAQAVEIALNTVVLGIETLPPPTSADHAGRAGRLLAELRSVEDLAVRAARASEGAPAVAVLVARIRTTARSLLLALAESPHATRGQRWRAARVRAALGVEEVAAALGVPAAAVEAAEADRAVDDDLAHRLTDFAAALPG